VPEHSICPKRRVFWLWLSIPTLAPPILASWIWRPAPGRRFRGGRVGVPRLPIALRRTALAFMDLQMGGLRQGAFRGCLIMRASIIPSKIHDLLIMRVRGRSLETPGSGGGATFPAQTFESCVNGSGPKAQRPQCSAACLVGHCCKVGVSHVLIHPHGNSCTGAMTPESSHSQSHYLTPLTSQGQNDIIWLSLGGDLTPQV
jgi:hypothetical protein